MSEENAWVQVVRGPIRVYNLNNITSIRSFLNVLSRHATSPASSRKPAVSAAARSSPPRPTSRAWPSTRSSGSGPRTTRRASGPSRPSRCTGSSSGTRCSTGRSRTPSGSSAARLNAQLQLPRPPPRRRRARTRPPSSGKASRATPACCTYQHLHREVCKFANVLKKLGIKTGDRVTIYMPMIPEAGDRHARLRPHRRDALGHLRRLLRRGRRRPQQRRQGQAASSPPTAAGGAARSCRSRQNVDAALDEVAHRREVHRLQPLQPARRR